MAFQIGGYEPCTVTDFEVPRKYGLRQTIADTLGVGGIMRGLRTVPHLWKICEDMLAVCPNAIMLQYVNPMAINTWAIAEKYPTIRQVGLCHSVQGTAMELAHDLDIPYEEIRYRSAGINHMAFFLEFEHRQPDGSYRSLYPDLVRAYREGRAPKPGWNPRCPNKVRYEMLTRLGYFVTESSEHFAEYTPYFIKEGREDLIEKFGIPLDEYPKRCIEQIERWKGQAAAYRSAEKSRSSSRRNMPPRSSIRFGPASPQSFTATSAIMDASPRCHRIARRKCPAWSIITACSPPSSASCHRSSPR